MQNTKFLSEHMSELLKSQTEFLENFNWHNFQEGIDAVDEKKPFGI